MRMVLSSGFSKWGLAVCCKESTPPVQCWCHWFWCLCHWYLLWWYLRSGFPNALLSPPRDASPRTRIRSSDASKPNFAWTLLTSCGMLESESLQIGDVRGSGMDSIVRLGRGKTIKFFFWKKTNNLIIQRTDKTLSTENWSLSARFDPEKNLMAGARVHQQRGFHKPSSVPDVQWFILVSRQPLFYTLSSRNQHIVVCM